MGVMNGRDPKERDKDLQGEGRKFRKGLTGCLYGAKIINASKIPPTAVQPHPSMRVPYIYLSATGLSRSFTEIIIADYPLLE